MSIKQIEISGYRSISHVKLDIRQIAAFIGQNGSGKSNILSAVRYFYRNLTEVWEEEGIFDTNNPFRNEIRIRIQYDLRNILRIVNHNQNDGHKDYEKYYRKLQAVFRKDIVEVELIKYKGKKLQWNTEYNTRQIIAALFPVYFVDAREIALTDWTGLWGLIGDLVKLRYEDMDKVQGQIIQLLRGQDANISMKMERLEQVLNKNRIDVKSMTAKELGKRLAEIIFDGQVFQYDSRRLSEYSNGTNAFNYTLFLIDILSLIKTYKLKEPVVILDEPEISLHIEYMDRLMEAVFDAAGQIQFILSTHSARCVKNLLECEDIIKYDIYHTVLKKKYTQLKKVQNLDRNEGRERVIATEAYMNSCFARMTLHVEGVSELEVFKNRYLKELFPVLKMAEIMTGMSNKVIYNLTSPSRRNYQTPSLAVVDMDQWLKLKKNEKNQYRFSLGPPKEYRMNREAYYYGKKRESTLYLRNRIERMAEGCNFFYHLPFFSCEDINFREMKELIHRYGMSYQMFIWDTTIEGALITEQNLPLFEEFMEQELKTQDYRKVVNVMNNHYFTGSCRLNYIRLVFSGKSDFLLTKKEICQRNPGICPDVKEKLHHIKKTSGWISRWLEFYFLKKAGIFVCMENVFQQFRSRDGEKLKEFLKQDFKELYQLICEIEKRMS